MFGKLKVASCRLDGAEKELYRSAFCSVCHDLRSNSGLLSTLLTNYDSTFWLILAQGLHSPRRPVLQERPCNGFPLKKVTTLSLPPALTRTNTALLWLLAEAKARDDLGDEQSRKAAIFLRLGGKNIEKFTSLLESEGFPVAKLKELPQKQRQAEAQPRPSVESVAAPIVEAMGETFAHMAKVCGRVEKRLLLQRFGERLALAIYLLDAVEDQKEDQVRGRFNACLQCSDFDVGAFHQAYGELRDILSLLDLSKETAQVCSRALEKLKSKFDGATLGRRSRPPRPLARLRQAGFLLNPFREKENCCSKYCDCDPCSCCDCCECGDCCGESGGCDGCNCDGCSGCDCSGCDCSGCDCSGCDCGGCDCGCAC